MEKKAKHIHKATYYFSLLTWIVSICIIIITLFFGISGFWFIGIIGCVLIQGIISGAFFDEALIPQTTKKHKAIDYCLLASKYISIGFAAVGFISLLIGGGGPEIINETYYLVSHGEIVRQISAGWFIYFAICEMLLFSCGMLYFSTNMALRIRRLYIIQKQ